MSDSSVRVVVTGGSGKIGSVLVRRLVERGHHVISIDRRHPPDATPGARFVFADLRQREILQPVFEQVDVVCHLGEIPGLHAGLAPNDLYSQNTAIGSCVIQTAADVKVKRLIYTSTAQVYGCWGVGRIAPPKCLPFDETHPLNPQNTYALSKVSNESYARLAADEQGLPIAAFRFPWVVMQPPDERWLRHLATNDGPMEGMGSYLYVNDAADAYVRAIEQPPRPGFEAYHFTAEDVWSGIPLRTRLEKHHPDFPPLPSDWSDFRCPVNCEKARSHFDWQPSFAVRSLIGSRRP